MFSSGWLLMVLQAAPSSPASQARPLARPQGLQEYAVDVGHSIVEFSIGFALSRVKGRFTQWRGTILYDAADPANSSITAIIESGSLDTGWPNRDRHLRTSDFFDVDRYPTITFQSGRIRRIGEGWVAEGPLTMHGITRPVAIPFQFLPGSPVRSPESRWMTLNLLGSVRLAHKDFGITGGSTFNSWFNAARSATMADSVDITLEVQAWMADAATHRVPAVDSTANQIRTEGLEKYLSRLSQRLGSLTVSQRTPYLRGQDFLVRALIGSGLKAEAVGLSTALTELYPASQMVFVLRGVALAVSGDARGATAAYDSARSLPRPARADSLNDPDWWYLDQLVRNAAEWRYQREAVMLARTVSELYPEKSEAQVTLGVVLFLSGDEAGAQAAWENALRIDPRDTRALEYRRRLGVKPNPAGPTRGVQ